MISWTGTLVTFTQGHESWWQSFVSTTVVVLHKKCKLQVHTHTHLKSYCISTIFYYNLSLSLYIYTHIYVYVFMCMYLYTYICVYICIKTATCRWEYRGSKEIKFDKLVRATDLCFLKIWGATAWVLKRYTLAWWGKTELWQKKTAVTWVHQNKGLAKGSLLRVKLHKLKPQLCWKWSSKQVARTHCQVWDRWPDFEVGW